MRHILLYESFTHTLQVYHQTSRTAAESIMQDGFKPGQGANYGKGIYFFLGEPPAGEQAGSARNDRVVVQGEISNLEGFLITDPQVARSLLGKEAPLPIQLEKIMGREWISTHDIQPILEDPNSMSTLSELNQGRWKREDSQETKTALGVQGNELKGWIRKHDDPSSQATWLICYDPARVKPMRIL